MTNVRKFIAALVGAVLSALSLGLLPDEWAPWITVAIAFLTAAGVYAAPNEQRYATGGVVSGTVARVAGESGPETLQPPYTPGDPAGGN